MAVKRMRLDEYLVETGQLPDLRMARGWIMGGKVLVEDRICDKPGSPITASRTVRLKELPAQFASRGGSKLAEALDRFQVTAAEKVVLDAGASTGGFTDCLLKRGARRVYCADVGHGQLRGALAVDPRIVNWERTNISDLRLKRFTDPLDLCVADLSFLSLTKAVPILSALFTRQPHFICLLKPLYEGMTVGDPNNPKGLASVLLQVGQRLNESSVGVSNIIVSPVKGGRGVVEFLLHLKESDRPHSLESLCQQAIEEALERFPEIAL